MDSTDSYETVTVPVAYAIMDARTDIDYTFAVRQGEHEAKEFAATYMQHRKTRIVPLYPKAE
jgi:hypothetical protein